MGHIGAFGKMRYYRNTTSEGVKKRHRGVGWNDMGMPCLIPKFSHTFHNEETHMRVIMSSVSQVNDVSDSAVERCGFSWLG